MPRMTIIKTGRGSLQGVTNTTKSQANGSDVDNDHNINSDQPLISTHVKVNAVDNDDNNIEISIDSPSRST